MTISGVSSSNTVYQTGMTSQMAQRKQDFQSLANALQSGIWPTRKRLLPNFRVTG